MLGLKCEYILHVHTHVRMTEQHTLGLKIVFLSIWFRVWYNYPLLLMCYSNSVRCGCSEVTASCRLWESLTPSKETASQFLQSMWKKTFAKLALGSFIGYDMSGRQFCFSICMRSPSCSFGFPGFLFFSS